MSPGIYLKMPPTSEETVFEGEITNNLAEIAGRAGIYLYLWHPKSMGIGHAGDLIMPLKHGLYVLKVNREYFETFNPPNGWGDYDKLVCFVKDYLAACVKYPQAVIKTCR